MLFSLWRILFNDLFELCKSTNPLWPYLSLCAHIGEKNGSDTQLVNINQEGTSANNCPFKLNRIDSTAHCRASYGCDVHVCICYKWEKEQTKERRTKNHRRNSKKWNIHTREWNEWVQENVILTDRRINEIENRRKKETDKNKIWEAVSFVVNSWLFELM